MHDARSHIIVAAKMFVSMLQFRWDKPCLPVHNELNKGESPPLDS